MFEKFAFYKRNFRSKSLTSTSPEEADFINSMAFFQQANGSDVHFGRNRLQDGNVTIICNTFDQTSQVETILNQNGFMRDRYRH